METIGTIIILYLERSTAVKKQKLPKKLKKILNWVSLVATSITSVLELIHLVMTF